MARDALEGKGPQRRPQKRLDRRLEGVAKAVAGGNCRLQMPWKLALAVRETVAIGWAPWRGGYLPPFQCIPGLSMKPRAVGVPRSATHPQYRRRLLWAHAHWIIPLQCTSGQRFP